MNFYRYEARDRSGAVLKGTVQAQSPDEVKTDLAGRGFVLLTIEPLGSPRTAPPAQPVFNAPVQPPSFVPRATPALSPQASPRPLQLNSVAPSSAAQTFRTKRGTDKQRFFIFSQLASAFRSGLNASDAFGQISRRSAEQFAESLRYASSAVAEGRAVSEVFAQFPDLYPPDVVGLTHAGEVAGFLPDAFDEIARQSESAHAFRRWFFWIWFLVVNALLSIPLSFVTGDAILSDWHKLNNTGGNVGTAGATGLFFQEMWRALIWPWGPTSILCYAALWALNRWFASGGSREFRHRLGLKAPVYGKRALQENLARFSWTMSRVSRIGISPARSWQLAAESVPNIAFRQELEHVGTALSGQEKMSDILFRSKLFPDEYAPMIATAEYTGDYSQALDKLAAVSAGEFVSAQNYAKARSGCWGLLFLFVVSAITGGVIMNIVDRVIPQEIMQDNDKGE
jgi:type II secretory pathway component PulF